MPNSSNYQVLTHVATEGKDEIARNTQESNAIIISKLRGEIVQ